MAKNNVKNNGVTQKPTPCKLQQSFPKPPGLPVFNHKHQDTTSPQARKYPQHGSDR